MYECFHERGKQRKKNVFRKLLGINVSHKNFLKFKDSTFEF